MSSESKWTGVSRPLLLGGGMLVVGLVAALTRLPEWSLDPSPDRDALVARFEELSSAAGFVPESDSIELRRASRAEELERSYGVLGTDAVEWLQGHHRGVFAEVSRLSRWQEGPPALLTVALGLDGEPWYAQWAAQDLASVFLPSSEPVPDGVSEALATMLLRLGESLGPAEERSATGNAIVLQPVSGASPPQYVQVVSPPSSLVFCYRRPGSIEEGLKAVEGARPRALIIKLLIPFALLASVAVLFLWLAMHQRLDLHSGALLVAICLLSSAGGLLAPAGSAPEVLGHLFTVGLRVVFLFLLWTAAESWLRSSIPKFTTSLDALKVGRLGPRGGRALLVGWGVGAGLAGLRLAALALAAAAPVVSPTSASLPLPSFSGHGNPLFEGASLGGVVILALALALHLLSGRRATAAAALLASLFASPVPVDPYAFRVLAALPVCAVLVITVRRCGLTALLAASVMAFLWPVVGFAALHVDWMPVSLAFSLVVAVGLPVLGVMGVMRPQEVELDHSGVPAFVRRLEDQRRVRYEMDLLARMQTRLLPAKLPRIPGYDLTARSILATEAGGDLYDYLWDERGRLWLAAGDVSGHGYSCAIAQAMTKAALASLIEAERSPSQVLTRIDRVLRTSRTQRNFTTLVLLRLDPGSGEGLLSNAGHPFPLLFGDGAVTEIELPGLPLGQGPDRVYVDVPLRLVRGGALVFYSDGLFEATNASGEEYGFVRPREALKRAARWRASEILEMMLADWRSHVGGGTADDDTTVMVLKRHPQPTSPQ